MKPGCWNKISSINFELLKIFSSRARWVIYIEAAHDVLSYWDILIRGENLKVTSVTKRQLLKMFHLRHRLRFFLFHRKFMFHSQDIQAFVFLTIPWFTESVRLWVLRQGVFLNIFFEPTSSPEQFLKNSPFTAWFRRKFLLDLIRQL